MIELARVDEVGAQRLADETGRVTYLSTKRVPTGEGSRWSIGVRMTTDRDEAVGWGESVAFAPRLNRHVELRSQGMVAECQSPADSHLLGGNLGVVARETKQTRPEWMDQAASYEQREFPPEQLRVVRVLEYRGPRGWIEDTLANCAVTPLGPFRIGRGSTGGEIVEQIRTTERLCRWCGGEHLGSCSEEECSGNPRKGRY